MSEPSYEVYCPSCKGSVDNKRNRVITDSCGHAKCRQCILNEIDGCLQCDHNKPYTINEIHNELINTPTPSIDCDSNVPPTSINKTIVVLEDKLIGINDDVIETELSPKKSRGRPNTSMPSHIERSIEDNVVTYYCKICNKKFQSRQNCSYHYLCHNPNMKSFVCKYCNKKFAYKSHLSKHIESHVSEQKQCTICCRKYNLTSSLKKHMRTHNNQQRYNCGYCTKKFQDKQQFIAHENKHKKVYPFKCTECNKSFSGKISLRNHEISHQIDNDSTKYRCDACGKCFKRKDSLKIHEQNHHRIQRQFECSICSKVFVDQKCLIRHRVIHTGITYKCPICSVQCGRKDNLIRHARNIHATIDSIKIVDMAVKKSNTTDIKSSKLVNPNVDKPNIPEESPVEEVETPPVKLDVPNSVGVIKFVGNPKVNNDHNTVSTNLTDQEPKEIKKPEIESAVNKDFINTRLGECSANNIELYKRICQLPNSRDKYANRYATDFNRPFTSGMDHKQIEIYKNILLPPKKDEAALRLTSESQQRVADSEVTDQKNCDRPNETNEKQYFVEMHWRKRTSQSFIS